MTVRKIVMVVCLLCSVNVSAYAQGGRGASWLRGTWEGTGYQIDTNETWTMRLKVQGGKYLIEYPSLNCGGEWRLLSINSRRARFREHIRFGLDACVNRGTVVIERLSARQLAYRFSQMGTREVSASAILNRQK